MCIRDKKERKKEVKKIKLDVFDFDQYDSMGVESMRMKY